MTEVVNSSTSTNVHVDCHLDQSFYSGILQTAASLPPVTKASLSELDLNWMIHNINLRVEVNYDHGLHFMPIQGQIGEEKIRDAKKYWMAIAVELRIYQHEGHCCRETGLHTPLLFKRRLPLMLESLRELLKTLVPDRDHPGIEQRFDIHLLMQQVEKGVLDIVRLSRWIADLVKNHCAPMRDKSADDMVDTMEKGCIKSDIEKIVEALEKLFNLLEAMKLDVANHQIRTFRCALIDDTIPFQQSYFSRKLRAGTIKIKASQDWYRKARSDHQKCELANEKGPKFEPLGALIHGILGQCTQKEVSELLDTLIYDRRRIEQLQEDVHDIIYLNMCVQAFNNFVGKRTVEPQTYEILQWRIITIVEAYSRSRNVSWKAQIENVAMEITQAAHVACSQDFPISNTDFNFTTNLLERLFNEKFSSVASDLHTKLEQMIFKHASIFQDRSPLQISDMQKNWQEWRDDNMRLPADPEDVARRIAHIAVLHWWVWAGLAYLDGEEEESRVDECKGGRRKQS